MKKELILLCMVLVVISGCSKYDKSVVDKFEIECETGFYDKLSKEQVEYLDTIYLAMNDEELKSIINEKTFEELNMDLMYTGMELYNQTTGIMHNGITYNYKDSVDSSLYGRYYKDIQCTSDKKITLEEAYAICDNEESIKAEEFLKYYFNLYNINESKNEFWLPVDGYENVQIQFRVEEFTDGTIHMTTPYLKNNSRIFSLFYERERFDVYANQEPKYSDEGKIYVGVNHGTISNRSLVLYIINYTDRKYAVDNSYILYALDDSKEYIEYKSYESESIVVLGTEMHTRDMSRLIIRYATDDKPLPPGTYKLEFGKDKEGYIYKEIEFTIE